MVWKEGEKSGAFELEDLGALKHLLNDSFEHSGGARRCKKVRMNGSVEPFQVLLLEGMKEAILTPASVAIVQHRYALRFKAQENFQDSSKVERVKHLCCLEISHLNGCVH